MTTATSLSVGQPAPEFCAPVSSGGELCLKSLLGRKVVLYFYPKDNTPGCSLEAQDFATMYPEFQAMGAEVIGVSRDSLASHQRFIDKFSLPFPLISDADEKVCRAYDVIQEKKNYGKTYLGIERSTFVVDRAGQLAHIERKVKVAGHAAHILDIVKTLP
ncbi:MAG: peroxiredoxin [Acidithiobacillus sp.]|uniref:peroxiredoxin n=1 Tax=Acidithiobacillus sp. TaxID=1872118 RepID=UPI0025C278F7|nr:peroxiredoxin [Acidithiobacillus sp.]